MNLLEDLFSAYYQARKHKRNTANQLHFELKLEENLVDLYHEIKERRYKVGRSVCFTVEHPVKREVFAADFRDRVVHHLLVGYINNFIERHLIYDCYSCRKDKGTHFGIDRLEHHIRSCSENYTRDCYVLKLDLKGYFMGIDREKLYQDILNILSKHMDEWIPQKGFWRDSPEYELVHYLLPIVLFNDPTINCVRKGKLSDWDGLPPSKSLFHSPEGCGLPIGNLTSQLFSNVYLNDFDNYVKRELKIKHYGRYVDDFFLIDTDKRKLQYLLPLMRGWLWEHSGIVLYPNKVFLQSYKKGVTFLGAIVKPHRRYVKNSLIHTFRSRLATCEGNLKRGQTSKDDLRHMCACINSYLGIMQHYKCHNIKKKLFSSPSLIFDYGYLNNGMEKYVLKRI